MWRAGHDPRGLIPGTRRETEQTTTAGARGADRGDQVTLMMMILMMLIMMMTRVLRV